MSEKKRIKNGIDFCHVNFYVEYPFLVVAVEINVKFDHKCAQNHEIALKLNDIDLIGFFTYQNRIAYVYLISILLTDKKSSENEYNENEEYLNRSHM